MELGLTGSVVVVTGGGSGIGLACVAAFAGEGARVVALDRDAEARDRVEAAGGAELVHVDVTVEGEVERAVAQTSERHGGVDVLVCSAGISGPFGRGIDEIDVDEWEEVMAVNVRGAFLAAKHCLPSLRARRGSIVLLASDSSFVAAPGMAAYCASKGALLMLTRSLAVDLAADGVRVNCVCPSVVDTPLARRDLGLPDGFADAPFPVHAPAQVARYVVLLASPVTATVNGTSLVADFGHLARSAFPA